MISLFEQMALSELALKYHCSYFVEYPIKDLTIIAQAINIPFMRLYALDQSQARITQLRQRFEHNNRVQSFIDTHSDSFFELARMIPYDHHALFFFEYEESTFKKIISVITHTRPAKRDIIVINSVTVAVSAVALPLERHFGRTHNIEVMEVPATILKLFPLRLPRDNVQPILQLPE